MSKKTTKKIIYFLIFIKKVNDLRLKYVIEKLINFIFKTYKNLKIICFYVIILFIVILRSFSNV